MKKLSDNNPKIPLLKRTQSLPILQQGNLRFLEGRVREHWHLGQNIVLSWMKVKNGVSLLFVPHYFFAEHTSEQMHVDKSDKSSTLNRQFLKDLIGRRRQMSEELFESTAERFELTPVHIEFPGPLARDFSVDKAIEKLLARYSITRVESRAVVLFDIVDFSLFRPFEQVSQLSSLSYSLNAAFNKLVKQNIEVNFVRTTTGDGFYVWNRETGFEANTHLFHLMLLVVADNAIAQRKSGSKTVPKLRAAFHIGSHYEFYQVEGMSPTLFSYIVGDVTIELARMVDNADPGQIFVGDFKTLIPTSNREGAYNVAVSSQQFVERTVKNLFTLKGVELSGECIESVKCYLTGEMGPAGGHAIQQIQLIDKHGLARNAYNLRIHINTDHGDTLFLGVQPSYGYSTKKAQKPSNVKHVSTVNSQ